MRDRNVMKCPQCGFMVLTESFDRDCARCDFKMVYICKESKYENHRS